MGNSLDCGDNSCKYAITKGGMRTNGGCRCLSNDPKRVESFLLHERSVLKSQLTKATEQIDLLNEEALSRIGVITHLETKLKKAEELIAKLEESLKLIINPIECPACSMDDPAQYVPCYCFEQWNTPEYRAQQALEEIAKWRKEK